MRSNTTTPGLPNFGEKKSSVLSSLKNPSSISKQDFMTSRFFLIASNESFPHLHKDGSLKVRVFMEHHQHLQGTHNLTVETDTITWSQIEETLDLVFEEINKKMELDAYDLIDYLKFVSQEIFTNIHVYKVHFDEVEESTKSIML